MKLKVKTFKKIYGTLQEFEKEINTWLSENDLGDPVIIRSNTPDDVLTVMIFYT